MTDKETDPFLQSLFAKVEADLPAQPFTRQVMSQTDRLRRRARGRRALMAMALALLAMPFEDFALALAQVLIVSLVEIDNSLAAQLLAPVNSVGGILSIVLLGIRFFHKRLFM